MATRSSILVWKIPWTEEPGGLYSAWSHKESNTTEQRHHQCELTSFYFHSERKCRAPCPSIPYPLLIVHTLHLLNLHSIKHSSSPVLHAHNSWSLRAKFKYWWWWFSHSVMPDSFVTPCTVARQAPLSMGFSRQEYWSGLHFLFRGIFWTKELNPSLLHCRQIFYCWATGGVHI